MTEFAWETLPGRGLGTAAWLQRKIRLEILYLVVQKFDVTDRCGQQSLLRALTTITGIGAQQ